MTTTTTTMTTKSKLPYGSWPSPITTDTILSSAISLADVHVGPALDLLWTEGRPEEKGRNALVYRSREGKISQVLGTEWNARTRVHEYGGVATCFAGGDVVFSAVEGPVFKAVKAADGWAEPTQVSPESDAYRYGDFDPFPADPTLIASILEDHTTDLPAQVVNSLTLLSTSDRKLYPITSGSDFYSSPRFSPSGTKIAYISWEHPEMPWTRSSLWVANVNLSNGKIDLDQVLVKGSQHKIAGVGPGSESVSQPRWVKGTTSDDEKLVFLSDRSGFSELYEWDSKNGAIRLLAEKEGGVDMGGPDWSLGQSTHASLGDNKWIGTSRGQLLITDLATRQTTTLATPFQSISALKVVSPTQIFVNASPSASPAVLALLTLGGNSVKVEIVKSSSAAKVEREFISEGQQISYPTKSVEGEAEGQIAYATFYEPASKTHIGMDGELPPLVVRCHGGPTASAKTGLDWAVQYFTSRGFCFVDVNYGGSTGFGRAYRERLNKMWGIVDVNDSIACVEHLVQTGKVARDKVAITGGSAGGFTVLAALCSGKVFGAGTSLYGVSDLALLAGDTHKFESQYLYGLLGGDLDQVPEVYRDRSPITNAASISAPLLFLQGDEDRVVPPEQATLMAEKIRSAGGKCEIIMFEGEGHGFRRSDSKKKATETELGFYRTTFGISGEE